MVQTDNMLLELLFIAGALVSVVVLIATAIALLTSRRTLAVRTLKALGVGWAVYLMIVVIVAISTPQRVLKMNEDLCFDEMCFAAAGVQIQPQLGLAPAVKAKGIFYIIAVRVSSHSRGRTQSEGGIRARLWKAGKYYDVSDEGKQAYIAAHGRIPQLTERLHPGESILSFQVFDLPRKTSGLGLVLDHGFTPGYLVIGESPVLHKPTMIQIN